MNIFEPDQIERILDKNLALGLRMLADAIEAGQIEGRCMRAQGVGGGANDARAHVLISIDIAAPVFSASRRNDPFPILPRHVLRGDE